eukprot:6804474-Alexandrium_andersonii.AAC.1
MEQLDDDGDFLMGDEERQVIDDEMGAQTPNDEDMPEGEHEQHTSGEQDAAGAMDGEFLEDFDQPTGERVRGPEPPAPQNDEEKRIQKGVRKMHFNLGHPSR